MFDKACRYTHFLIVTCHEMFSLFCNNTTLTSPPCAHCSLPHIVFSFRTNVCESTLETRHRMRAVVNRICQCIYVRVCVSSLAPKRVIFLVPTQFGKALNLMPLSCNGCNAATA